MLCDWPSPQVIYPELVKLSKERTDIKIVKFNCNKANKDLVSPKCEQWMVQECCITSLPRMLSSYRACARMYSAAQMEDDDYVCVYVCVHRASS